jgi:hypothetical protein
MKDNGLGILTATDFLSIYYKHRTILFQSVCRYCFKSVVDFCERRSMVLHKSLFMYATYSFINARNYIELPILQCALFPVSALAFFF